ncbi:MAG: hypothetical protein WDO12_06605 [Pseudomonadota bacterium]
MRESRWNTGAREAAPGCKAWTLLRLQREEVWLRGALDYISPNAFIGSVLDLDEDAAYEVRLTLTDPDGVAGSSRGQPVVKVLTVHTRAEPRPATGGHVYNVYPPGFTGKREEPAFSGLLEAYYVAALGGDLVTAPRHRGYARATSSACMPACTCRSTTTTRMRSTRASPPVAARPGTAPTT